MGVSVKKKTSALTTMINTMEGKTENVLDRELETTRRHAYRFAPKDTTALANSLTVDRARLRRWLRDGVFYGVFQEYGTRYHRAQSFIRPAFERLRRRILPSLKRELFGQ